MQTKLLTLILASVTMSAAAQILLKMGTGATTAPRSGDPGSEFIRFLASPLTIGGLGLYGASAVLWLFVLARAPLTLAYPFVGLAFIMTMIGGVLFLGESVPIARVVGTIMIAAGCILVARSA